MEKNEIVEALIPVINILDKLNISYFISGSLASSAYGLARATLDIDIVISLQAQQIKPLVNHLKDHYYIDSKMISDALKKKTSFNILHLNTMLKIDFFIPEKNSYSQTVFERKKIDTLQDTPGSRKIYLISPEDIILNKLVWYKSGNQISEKQWSDVIGVIKIQGNDLDRTYLKKWSTYLDIRYLLEKALLECKLEL
jgi:hypothetical protein